MGRRVVLQKVSEQVAECLRRAAEADARAEVSADAKNKTDYQLIADAWRTLARSHEFQRSLGRFVSFNQERQNAFPSISADNSQILLPAEQQNKPDALDWLARVSERIRPYSTAAFAIAFAAVAAATLLRFAGGWASTDLRFAIYVPAILATGLLAGIPAAIGATIASVLVTFWAFMPPYFEFKWPSEVEQINILLNAIPYFIAVYFAHLCRVVFAKVSTKRT
jgi:hypothetical protein